MMSSRTVVALESTVDPATASQSAASVRGFSRATTRRKMKNTWGLAMAIPRIQGANRISCSVVNATWNVEVVPTGPKHRVPSVDSQRRDWSTPKLLNLAVVKAPVMIRIKKLRDEWMMKIKKKFQMGARPVPNVASMKLDEDVFTAIFLIRMRGTLFAFGARVTLNLLNVKSVKGKENFGEFPLSQPPRVVKANMWWRFSLKIGL